MLIKMLTEKEKCTSQHHMPTGIYECNLPHTSCEFPERACDTM